MIRVALFTPEYPPHIYGGLGTHVAYLTDTQADAVEFEIFLPERGNYQVPHPGIHLHEVRVLDAETNLQFWLRYCQAAAQAARQLQLTIDLIHCHDWMTVLAGLNVQKRLNLPLVYNTHLPQASPPTLQLENSGLAHANLVLVNSLAVRQELAEREIPVNRIRVVPNGVDLSTFHPPTQERSPEDKTILFAGRLVPQKGVEVLLKAFGVALGRIPDLRLVIAGDGDLELHLKRLTYHLGFPHRVSFVGWQTGQALVEQYQKASLVVMPSYYEPFGIVALEAMACGCPVLASRVGGLEEIIQDGLQGYLVPAGDYLLLAQRIVDMFLHPDRRLQMGRAAYQHAQQYAWQLIGETLLGLYNSLLGSQAAFPPVGAKEIQQDLLDNLDPDLRAIASDLLSEKKDI